ncbi:30S ribosome-binding factor RbfA [Clostridium thermobutyricum]|uniref:Ribosome-binding factor A n=2 Tax=Clostridium thermobutyricum TaxID=29372 RepID=N9WG01_9CLOT|nr:30S ribosome-binding factor RbfA [Clostridium thermobutyricum]ENZ01795.1 ribosome-binding factor A [Clostridium thermobutyricum]OPX51222.1 ribosome-binding factor A [Clostridium thermobutyricum DSM 4928]
MANYRGGRINEEVKKEVSNLIQNEVKDPRLTAMISVTDVEVTRDLSYAKVYVSIFSNSKEEKEENLKALKGASGFIRREVGRRVKLRAVPQIIFELDESIDYGMKIDELIERSKK